MVYITTDGTVCNNAPWNINRLLRTLNGAATFVILFFKSLIGFDSDSRQDVTSRPARSSSNWSSRESGSGNRSFRSGGDNGGPSRRIMTMRDINPPRVGGCPGGACGI